ncbi:hypothetical protein [Georgenia muralis]|nr:hypothetical protein [Georgenia muralis]
MSCPTLAGTAAYAPGDIDQDNDLVVGPHTDAPIRRAIVPNGG